MPDEIRHGCQVSIFDVGLLPSYTDFSTRDLDLDDFRLGFLVYLNLLPQKQIVALILLRGTPLKWPCLCSVRLKTY